MGDNDEHGDQHELLSPLEAHIIDLCTELTACIAGLVGDDETEFPLAGEFDQRLLLEHTQIIEALRVLAQAASRGVSAPISRRSERVFLVHMTLEETSVEAMDIPTVGSTINDSPVGGHACTRDMTTGRSVEQHLSLRCQRCP